MDIKLQVSRTTSDAPTKNEASIIWPEKNSRIMRSRIAEGDEPYAIIWERGTTVLWVAEKRGVRRVDFSDGAKVLK